MFQRPHHTAGELNPFTVYVALPSRQDDMDTSLPIYEIEARFREAVREGPVVVTAPTGSGKSTLLPIWLGEEFDGRILVIEPRRVACRSLAGYVAQMCGTRLGDRVGYRIRFTDCCSAATRILFVTPGVALRMLRSVRDNEFCAVLIDEYHERGWEVDLALAILRERRAAGLGFGLVVASATLDAEGTADMLGGQMLHAAGRTFPVDISYAGGVPFPSTDRLAARVAGVLEEQFGTGLPGQGDALVFLPGMREIDACCGALRRLAARNDLELVKVHGTLPTEAVAEALAGGAAKRRIFLATNVAETSLTIPNVTLVVDSGLARQRLHRGRRSSLVLGPVSLASMDQRAGRAGRVAPGQCIRLWDRAYEPQPRTAPEVCRIELDDVLLNASACGLNIANPDSAPWPSPPPDFAFHSARERLVSLGAIAADGTVTPRGEALSSLPLSVVEARLLADVPPELAGDVCDIVALMQTRSCLLLPEQQLPGAVADQVFGERQKLLGKCGDDVTAEVTMLRSGDPKIHHLHPTALAEARQMSQSLRGLTGCPETDPVRDRTPFRRRPELLRHLLSCWPEAGFVVRERALKQRRGKGTGGDRRHRGEPWANGTVEVLVDPSPYWGNDRDDERWPEAGLIFDLEWVATGGTGITGFGRFVLPCTYRDLAEAGIGEVSLAQPSVQFSKAGEPRITALVRRSLGGVVIETAEEEVTGEALRRVLADLILEGRLLKGLAAELLDDLHLCAILADWPTMNGVAGSEAPVRDCEGPRSFLVSTLRTLGVEEDRDLSLLEPADLRPDFYRSFGISEEQVRQLRDDFPRIWNVHGSQYACHVVPRSGKVVLEPVNAAAKRANPPDAWMLPSFRGFNVDFRKASRVLHLR